ncbi:hypothetical protein BCR35DRAFT_302912 [Leucosporidium creatinivorum]|uniref:GPN-loop GTPase n=1 Tax=Leucosporidium creatinivorum TaxID=106004 RepID=A0A1Y2FN70_9BASI|nr:hypothetical protein BCR35DRAFT_302912 [Leucosporidium creatinivorum]
MATASSPKGKEKESTTQPTTTPTPSPNATGIIVIGMAGSGKTTFMQRLNSYLHTSAHKQPYILNLDPAVTHLPFSANIDIRDTVDYAEVMKQYNLGPNGGILTALNLFTTKFDQVLGLVEKRATEVDYVLLDTPGQIEIFTWSASGAIITDAMASALPTCVAYIIDTPRTTSPATFMSNMLYACSILYKTRLPFILVFNKTDVQPHSFALEWMRDFEAFQEALLSRRNEGGEDGPGYMDSLMNSMSLVLDEFYKHLRAVGVSAMTGEGMPEFFQAVDEAREEYLKDYKPELDAMIAERAAAKSATASDSLSRLMADMAVAGGPSTLTPEARAHQAAAAAAAQKKKDGGGLESVLQRTEEEERGSSDDEGEVIDKSSRTDYYDLPTSRRPRGTAPPSSAAAGSRGGRQVVDDDGTVWPAP